MSKWFIKKTNESFSNVYSFINRVSFIYKGSKNSAEACYRENNNITEVPKCYCGADRKFKNFLEGYNTHCGNKKCWKKSNSCAVSRARKKEELQRKKHTHFIQKNISWYIQNKDKKHIKEPFLQIDTENKTILDFLKSKRIQVKKIWHSFLKENNIFKYCLFCKNKKINSDYGIFDLENCEKNFCKKCQKKLNLSEKSALEIKTETHMLDFFLENISNFNSSFFSNFYKQKIQNVIKTKLLQNNNSDKDLLEKLETYNRLIKKYAVLENKDFKILKSHDFNIGYIQLRHFSIFLKNNSPFVLELCYLKCFRCGKKITRNFFKIIREKNKTSFCSKICYKQAKNEGIYFQPISNETRIKLSNHMKRLIQNGILTPCITDTWTKQRIYYKDKKFRSSWELCFYLLNPHCEYEKVRIPYIKNNGKNGNYIVDFIDSEKKILYEIKPKELFKADEENYLKEKAAIEWCNKNNHNYELISEVYFKANFKRLECIIEQDLFLEENILRIIKTNLKIWSKA